MYLTPYLSWISRSLRDGLRRRSPQLHPACRRRCLPRVMIGKSCAFPKRDMRRDRSQVTLLRSGLQKVQHLCRGFEFGETEGAAFERERITAPLLNVPVLVDVRRL